MMTDHEMDSIEARAFRKYPSPLGWLFAVISLGVSVCFVLGVAIWSERLHQGLVLRYSLAMDKLGSLNERELRLGLNRPPSQLSSLAYETFGSRDISRAPEAMKRIVLSLWYVSKDNLDAAAETMSSLEEAIDPDYYANHPDLREAIRLVGVRFNHFLKLAENSRREREELERDESIIETARKDYSTLRSDLAELLDLDPPPSPPPNSFEFYSSGVLSGLPTLPSLPDGIQSVGALKETVSGLGGSLEVAGNEGMAAFNNRLESLLDYSREVERTIQETTRDLVEGRLSLDSAILELDTAKNNLFNDAKLAIENNVSALTELRLDDIFPIEP